jgi:leukotriene-A4 hydrolase
MELFRQQRSWHPACVLAVGTAALVLASCGVESPPATKNLAAKRVTQDHHSFSRPDRVRVTHAVIDWTVDFDARELRGSVTWYVERAPGAEDEPLILDSKGLIIESVYSGKGQPVDFRFGADDEILGAPLSIQMAPGDRTVTIAYRTGPGAAALQWLTPEQTTGKKHPFLYSHSTAIYARTFWPCQDSPAVRFTYEAEMAVPSGLKAVMAAEMLPGGGGEGAFRFRMPQPVPSYLVAIAVGNIVFRELGPRTGVYAEPSVVDAAAFEFVDTEAMLDTVERLYGPYRWGRYDLLVMPPSYPAGGMENPRLTFVSPAVIAGDRSLTSVVAHEIAHAWSGNLVNGATWSDLWITEGPTCYIEQRVVQSFFGKAFADMLDANYFEDLMEEMPTLDEGFTALHNVSLEGHDPRDNYSDVPYTKAEMFLRVLEQAVGREDFDAFLNRWFDDNAFQSRTTMDFEKALARDLFGGDDAWMQSLQVDEWLYGSGLPNNAPVIESEKLTRARLEAEAFVNGDKTAPELPGDEWSAHEWIRALRELPAGLPESKAAELDDAWSLSESGNCKVLKEWFLVCIRCGYQPADPALERYLTEVGRLRYLKPLYTELAKTPEGRKRALAIYAEARPLYHQITVNGIDKILGPVP